MCQEESMHTFINHCHHQITILSTIVLFIFLCNLKKAPIEYPISPLQQNNVACLCEDY